MTPPQGAAAKVADSLQACRLLLTAGLWEPATSDVYYACLHAARALLATAGVDTDSHRGTQEMLSLHFVRGGLLPKRSGRDLKTLMGARELADYGVARDIDAAAAAEAVRLALGLLGPILDLLEVRDAGSAEAVARARAEAAALAANLPPQA